jgi:hypothetical protein
MRYNVKAIPALHFCSYTSQSKAVMPLFRGSDAIVVE